MDSLLNSTRGGFGSGFDLHALKQPEKNNGYLSGSNSSQTPIELLENELGKSLSGFKPVSQLNTADFTPAAVADRITGFVETAIKQRAGSELEAQSMLQQAREGIAQGFAEAREILSSIPQSQAMDKIDTEIDLTESLIFQGLGDLESASIETPRQQQIGQLVSESASRSTQFKQSSQASIEIMTRDGDKIEVNYSAIIQSASNQSYSINQNRASASFELSSASSSAFQFSVEGNLDAGERQAINDLLSNVGDLAQQFFNGDVQAAFNSAQELGFDSAELKSFALDFQQSTYVEVTQTYQRTEQISNPLSALQGTDRGPGLAIDVLSQLTQLIDQARESSLIEQPENTIKALLTDMLDLLSEGIDMPAKSHVKEVIESV